MFVLYVPEIGILGYILFTTCCLMLYFFKVKTFHDFITSFILFLGEVQFNNLLGKEFNFLLSSLKGVLSKVLGVRLPSERVHPLT